jgi:hypothetical protein
MPKSEGCFISQVKAGQNMVFTLANMKLSLEMWNSSDIWERLQQIKT